METVLGLLSSSMMVGGTKHCRYSENYNTFTHQNITDNVKVPRHGDHGVCVDLTHVVTLVLRLDVSDLQGPGVMTVVDDVEPGYPRDHVTTNGQNHLAVYMNPSNLNTMFSTVRMW